MKSILRILLLPACTLFFFPLCSPAQADGRIIFQDDFETVEIAEEPENWVIPERRPTRVPVTENSDGSGRSMVFPLKSTLVMKESPAMIGTPALFSNSGGVNIFLRFQLDGIANASGPSVHIAGVGDWPLAVTLLMDRQEGRLINIGGGDVRETIAELPSAGTWIDLVIRMDFRTGELRFVLNDEEVKGVFSLRDAGVADEKNFRILFERRPNTDTLRLDRITVSEAD